MKSRGYILVEAVVALAVLSIGGVLGKRKSLVVDRAHAWRSNTKKPAAVL